MTTKQHWRKYLKEFYTQMKKVDTTRQMQQRINPIKQVRLSNKSEKSKYQKNKQNDKKS
jgi:hypothetical protein